MSTCVWIGRAKTVAQVNTVTPANVAATNTFTVTINQKAFTHTATGSTVAEVTAGLVALLSASLDPDVTELTFTDSTTHVTITGRTDGTPFTQTSGATGGTATNTTATATAASSPWHWSIAANWQGGAVPVNSDDVVIDNTSVPIKYGLDQNAVTLASLTIGQGFTGEIGLPERNVFGYAEYRDTYLKVSATAFTVGTGSGQGSGRIKVNVGSAQTTLVVQNTGQPLEQGLPALLFKGTHSSNAVSVVNGSVGVAVLPGEAATVATLTVGGGQGGRVQAICGAGVTLTTLNQSGGQVQLGGGLTTVNKSAGELAILGTGAATTINNDGGPLYYQSSGTITTLRGGAGSVTDFRRDTRARTVTNCTLQAGAELYDPARTVTFSNDVVLNRCDLPDVKLAVGTHVTVAVSAGP